MWGSCEWLTVQNWKILLGWKKAKGIKNQITKVFSIWQLKRSKSRKYSREKR